MIRYDRQIQLTALLYFHRISDNRMGTSLPVFEKLCREDFKRVFIVTTMRDEVEVKMGASREDVWYWRSMITRGWPVQRFYGTQKSAFDVLTPIIDEVNARSEVLLQKEMN